MAETTCPVFRPTEQEFKSFRRYIEDIVDPIAGKVGLCKIVPPPGEPPTQQLCRQQCCNRLFVLEMDFSLLSLNIQFNSREDLFLSSKLSNSLRHSTRS